MEEKKELAIASMLVRFGFRWLAREKNGELLAWTHEPKKIGSDYETWSSTEGAVTDFDGFLNSEKGLFAEIKAEDDKAYYIPANRPEVNHNPWYFSTDLYILWGLSAMGIKWIGRDYDGSIYCYRDKPHREAFVDKRGFQRTFWKECRGGRYSDFDKYFDCYLYDVKTHASEPTNVEELFSRKFLQEFPYSFSKRKAVQDVF